MAAGYDGSIRIDTSVSATGFNAGIKKISASARGALNGVLLATLKIGDKIRGAFDKAVGAVGKAANIMKKLLLGALIVFGASIATMFRGLGASFTNLLENNLKGTKIAADIEDIKNKFTELKFSIVAAFLPLVEAAVPYIKTALDWLAKLFNNVAMITAAWLGQKQVLQIIPGSAAKFAKETEKAKKSAQGALAAFDQINILTKQTAETTANPQQVDASLVPVTPEAVDAAKNALEDLKEKAKTVLGELFSNIKNSFLDFIYWDKWVAFVKQKWQEFKDFIFLDNWVAFFTAQWEVVKIGWRAAWEDIKQFAATSWIGLKAIWSEIAPLFQIWWDTVVDIVQDRIQFIHDIIQSIKTVFQGVITFLHGAFTGNWREAWDGVVMVFKGIWDGMFAFIKLSVNSWIDVLNGLIRAIVLGVNTVAAALNSLQITIPDWVPEIGGGTLGFNIQPITAPQIPRLATGAVVPPHSNMLAMIGEGNQTEIVTPEDKMRQVVQDALSGANQTIENVIVLDGDVLFRSIKRVERRRGPSLITGGATG